MLSTPPCAPPSPSSPASSPHPCPQEKPLEKSVASSSAPSASSNLPKVTNDEGCDPSGPKSIVRTLELENQTRKREVGARNNDEVNRDEGNASEDVGQGSLAPPPRLQSSDASISAGEEATEAMAENLGSDSELKAEQADMPMSATKPIEPLASGREDDSAGSAPVTKNDPASNLEADVNAIVLSASQMSGSKDEIVHIEESNGSHTSDKENKGDDEASSSMDDPVDPNMTDQTEKPSIADENTTKENHGGNAEVSCSDQILEARKPRAAAEHAKPPSHPTYQIKEKNPDTNEVPLLDRSILFDDSIINISAFDDGSVDAKHKVQGWTNAKWVAATDKVLRFSTPVLRVMPGRFFWSADVFKKRILAIYNLGSGDVILILRLPTDKDEVRRLWPIRGSLELTEHNLHTFLVVESAADPKVCKIQLSQLTHTTSVLSRGQNDASRKSTPQKRSCFSILTPTEVATLSTAFLPDDCFDDIKYASKKFMNDTLRCEDAIISTLFQAQSLDNLLNDGTDLETWKHAVVLGTLHSYVICGHDQTLKDSLENALQIQNSQSNRENECGNIGEATAATASGMLDCAVIDAKDASGKTALHYACRRRRSSTIQILVSAGADCSVSQTVDELTPCHICAQSLDEKGLSIILSASYPTRPNPNTLDRHGRTPMYLAAVEGNIDEGDNNAIALGLCLSALEAWGGQLLLYKSESKELLHPVHCASAQWKPEELGVILSHCRTTYPLTGIDDSDRGGISLTAMFHYPIHAALVSLRRRIVSAFEERAGTEFNAEFLPQEPALVKTLQTLLEHGFEPNERFEGIVGQGEAIKTLSSYFGTNPLQILALAAADAKAKDLKHQGSGVDGVESTRILKNIMRVIRESAELLVKNGARTNVQPPLSTRLDRATPTGCYSLKEALEDQKDLSMSISYRRGLKLDGNDEVLSLMGGASRVSTCQNAFGVLGKTIEVTGTLTAGSSSLNSNAPGGSDNYSCAICWSEFGIISNRKHLCRVSCRNVCNDCSTKRLVKNAHHRVSDGQFLLARAKAKKANAKLQAGRELQMRKQRQSLTQSRKSLGLKSMNASSIVPDTEAKQIKLSTKAKITSAISGLGQTKDAVLERGNKLESLADKTEALNEASLDFANMAKELNQSQNSWW